MVYIVKGTWKAILLTFLIVTFFAAGVAYAAMMFDPTPGF